MMAHKIVPYKKSPPDRDYINSLSKSPSEELIPPPIVYKCKICSHEFNPRHSDMRTGVSPNICPACRNNKKTKLIITCGVVQEVSEDHRNKLNQPYTEEEKQKIRLLAKDHSANYIAKLLNRSDSGICRFLNNRR